MHPRPTILAVRFVAAWALGLCGCSVRAWRPPMDAVRQPQQSLVDLAPYCPSAGTAGQMFLRRELTAPPESAEAYPFESDAAGRREGLLLRLGAPDLARYIAEQGEAEPREFFKWPGDPRGNNAGFFLEFDPPLLYLPGSIRTDEPTSYEGRVKAYNRWGHPARAGTVTRQVILEGREDVSALEAEYSDCLRLRAETRIRLRWGPHVDVTEYLWLAPRVGVIKRLERIKGLTFPFLFETAWVSELAPADHPAPLLAADRLPPTHLWRRAALYLNPLLPTPRVVGMSVEYAEPETVPEG